MLSWNYWWQIHMVFDHHIRSSYLQLIPCWSTHPVSILCLWIQIMYHANYIYSKRCDQKVQRLHPQTTEVWLFVQQYTSLSAFAAVVMITENPAMQECKVSSEISDEYFNHAKTAMLQFKFPSQGVASNKRGFSCCGQESSHSCHHATVQVICTKYSPSDTSRYHSIILSW